ncbi:MAG TPA: ECF-type sigma factor [Nevskiaceae bacterium]|nr:ECF-type sigma factor [Nevskiaceae bacterium]
MALAVDQLLPAFYADVRRLARAARLRVGADGTLQTTAVVHEAYLKLRASKAFADQNHFLRCAAIAMRQVLVSHARNSLALKRGGTAQHIPLDFAEDEAIQLEGDLDQSLVAVHGLVEQLAGLNARLAKVVECRFFAGYTEEETAAALDVDVRTIRRDWAKAKAWLRSELERQGVTAFDVGD